MLPQANNAVAYVLELRIEKFALAVFLILNFPFSTHPNQPKVGYSSIDTSPQIVL
jgi:hypothetical protein